MKRLLFGVLVGLAGIPAAWAEPGAAPAPTPPTVFNVRDFGAIGDGRAKDTAAIQNALDRCSANGGGTVLVPAGVYLTGSLVLRSNTTLRFESRAWLMGSPDAADYPLVRVRWEGEFAAGHRALVSAEGADRVAIVGPGTILGPPVTLSRLRNPRGPCLIELTECADARLEGFTTQYQGLWSVHFLFCRNLAARNLTVRAVNTNGDGMDVDSCDGVLIENCSIDAGDDAISLKSGRGMEAVRIGRPTQNVLITNCTLISSQFAGLGLGTEMSGGIRNVRVDKCVLSGHQNGIFIKSRDGRGGYIEDITFENLTVFKSPTLVGINLAGKGIQASEPVSGEIDKWARVRNVRFSRVRVENVAELVAGWNIPAQRPLDGLALSDISGTCRKGIALANSTNVSLTGISVTGYQGPLVTTTNVHGAGW